MCQVVEGVNVSIGPVESTVRENVSDNVLRNVFRGRCASRLWLLILIYESLVV